MLTNDEVFKRRLRIEGRMRAADAKWEQEIARLKLSLRRLQKACKHTKTRFYGDPAGGNDSFDECVYCEARL
jgi:hypothetical protein